jgi:putative Holliday junction resolvase
VRYLGVDYGTKRIGLSLSDEEGKIAFPHSVVESNREALSIIAALSKEKNVGAIVMGESKNFKNEPNAVMEDIEQFKNDLAELTGLVVEYEPEFFSSAMAAHQFTPDGSRKAPPSQEKLDAAAAALILQSYLDRKQTIK